MDRLIWIIAIMAIIIWALIKSNINLRFQKRSHVVKTGKWIEDYFPFLEDYPVDYKTVNYPPINDVGLSLNSGK